MVFTTQKNRQKEQAKFLEGQILSEYLDSATLSIQTIDNNLVPKTDIKCDM